jgi:hypothetical protein
MCEAQATVVPKLKIKFGPINGYCEALGYIADETSIRYKWDFPSDIRFTVPYVNNKFTVR